MSQATEVSAKQRAAIWVAIYVAFQLLFRHLHLPEKTPPGMVLAVVLGSVALFMLLTVLMTASLTRTLMVPRAAVVAMVLGLAGWLGVGWLLGRTGGAKAPPRPEEWRLLLFQVLDVSRAIAAVGIGALGAMLIRERNILLPAAIFAAFADYFMVHFGTVHVALSSEKGRKVVSAMSSHAPTVRWGKIALPALTVGMADIVFIAFFVACTVRFALNARATLAAFAVVLTGALVYVSITGRPVPALAPMAIAFVAVNFRRFQLSRSELQAVAVVFVVVALATAGFFVFRAVSR